MKDRTKNQIKPAVALKRIQEFACKPVKEDALHHLIKAAMAAPSTGDQRPWHFVVIREAEIMEEIQNTVHETYVITRSSIAILLCGDKTLQKHVGFWPLDCAAATENILIEAQQLELGAVRLGIYPVEGRIQRFRAILNIPAQVVPFSLVVVGHPDKWREPEDRFDPARVHYDGW